MENTTQASGVFELLYSTNALIFLLVFSIVLLLLEATKIFETKEKDKVAQKLNFLFSLGMALMVLGNEDIVNKIEIFAPKASTVILVIFLFVLTLGLFSGTEIPKWLRGAIVLVVFLVLVYFAIFTSSSFTLFKNLEAVGAIQQGSSFVIAPELVGTLAFIGALVITMWWMLK